MSTVKALLLMIQKLRSQVRALTQISIAEFEFEEAMDGEDALNKLMMKLICYSLIGICPK